MFLTKGQIFYPTLSNFMGEILLPAGEQLQGLRTFSVGMSFYHSFPKIPLIPPITE